MSKNQKGVLLIAIGAICFSAKAIFIKLAYKQFDVDDLTLLTLRFGMALSVFILITFWNYSKGKMKAIEKRDIGWIAFLAMLGYYLASWLDFKGLQYISAGIERIILFIYPSFVVIFSRIFLKKTISRTAVIALAITYFGIIIIGLDPHLLEAKNLLKGAVFILISALTYSVYLTFGSEIINKYGSVNFNCIAMIFSSAYVLIHYAVFSEVDLLNLPTGVYIYGFLLAMVSTIIPTFLVMEGIRILGAGQGAVVSSIGPVSTIVMGYYFLGEALSFQEMAGSALVLGGILLIGKKK